jgi:hypothetical protein
MPRIFEKKLPKREAVRRTEDYYKLAHPFRRWRLRLSVFLAAVAAILVVSLLALGRHRIYSPGALSQPHSMLEDKCGICHGGSGGASVGAVSVTSCRQCHAGSIHHDNQIFQEKTGGTPACSTCHIEHRGRGVRLTAIADQQCTMCHSALTSGTAIAPQVSDMQMIPSLRLRPVSGYAQKVTDFGTDHPEFRVIRDSLPDSTPLKLNHKKHVELGKETKEGKHVGMECLECHRLSKNGFEMEPFDYVRDCQSCHPLSFDSRIRQTAPHGNAEAAADFVRRAFLDHFAANPASIDPKVLESQISAARQWLFTKRCGYCHEFGPSEGLSSVPVIIKPEIPRVWLGHSHFSHARHQELKCDSCHESARQSEKTSDVLVPARRVCLQCHTQAAGAPSQCVTCHTYHSEPSPFPYPGKFSPKDLAAK